MKFLSALFLMGLIALSAVAQAGEQATIYAAANPSNLMLAMLRSNALDQSDPLVRNDYLLIQECELYRQNFRDEFKMRRLEEAAAKTIAKNRAGWPNAFTFDAPLRLDRYDFKGEQYLLDKDSQLLNVNSFVLLYSSESGICIPGKSFDRFPASVGVRIDQPISVAGIPLPQTRAEALLHDLQANGGSSNKQIYARFNIAVTFMPPIEGLLRSNEAKLSRYYFDGRLMQIEFFEDANYKRPIWTLMR